MRNNKHHKANGHSNANIRQVVDVRFRDPVATTVAIAGTFNDWRPGATPMISMGDGRWLKKLVLPPGRYEYRLVVDGEWIADPLAPETAPNPFGGFNSVLRASQNGGALSEPSPSRGRR
jgi:1,4-alpha-glucan branching enzyme